MPVRRKRRWRSAFDLIVHQTRMQVMGKLQQTRTLQGLLDTDV